MKDSLEELAALYVLDQLDPVARADCAARILRDPALAARVHDYELALEKGVRALPTREPPADMLDRIEARLLQAELETPSSRNPFPTAAAPAAAPAVRRARVADEDAIPFPWLNWARWGIAAVIAVSLATLAVQSFRRPTIIVVGLDPSRNTLAELPLSSAKDPDARFMQLASLAQDYWRNPQQLPVRAQGAGTGSRGYALFDPSSRQGFIAIEQLPAPAANQRYHLWIVDPETGRPHNAGILPTNPTNRGLYSFTLDANEPLKSAQPEFFVTIEESAESAPADQPRGKVVLGGQKI